MSKVELIHDIQLVSNSTMSLKCMLENNGADISRDSKAAYYLILFFSPVYLRRQRRKIQLSHK